LRRFLCHPTNLSCVYAQKKRQNHQHQFRCGLTGNTGQANYAASKAGLIGLTKSVAKELASRGICCNAIAPGFIRTDMTAAFSGNDAVVGTIPMKRIGRPEEVAELALFLASPVSDYITGEVIRIDGGLAM
jgi:3-oxoacyl-[acyl-carrier protein] reductase